MDKQVIENSPYPRLAKKKESRDTHLITYAAVKTNMKEKGEGGKARSKENLISFPDARRERVQKRRPEGRRGASREEKHQFPRTPLKSPYNNTEGIFPPPNVIHHVNVMTRGDLFLRAGSSCARRIKETVPSTYTEIIIVIRLFRTYEKDGGQR